MYEKIKFQLLARNVRWREEFEHFKNFKQRVFIGGFFSLLSSLLRSDLYLTFEFYLNGWCALLSLRVVFLFEKDV